MNTAHRAHTPAASKDAARPSAAILERNLRAIAIASPKVADRIRQTPARQDIDFTLAPDGALTATLPSPRGKRTLASPRRPLEEARHIAESIDVASTPGVVALGFGLGHHVERVARSIARSGVLLCFEPDVPLLRAVLERIDHSEWIRACNVGFLTEQSDSASISEAVKGSEGVFVLGTALLEHPASRARCSGQLDAFSTLFTSVMRAARTTVLTTLVQSEATLRNLLMNTDWYVSTSGIADLAGIARGRAAVVVSAGPSLERNIELLARPGVRDRVVIIAVQTVLKQLLARGIRPHFVTALDHHEISRRFYEGLTAEQVAGVTLVVEPRANPAILESFPGAIRCCEDDWLEEIVGGIADKKGKLPAGATVAHLAYSLARHLGCDPVIMVGQDLGFTDGQYYAAGAAIHSTWGSELNPFRTLEMFEWERIARSRRLLRRLEDTHGRPIYTDEQMAAYLVQFEQMFGADAEQGLRTIDATEGGVAKRNTTAMTLADALDTHGGGGGGGGGPPPPLTPLSLPLDLSTPTSGRHSPSARDRIAEARARFRVARQEVSQVARLSADALDLLKRMQRAYPDERKVNDLIRRIEPITAKVNAQPIGFTIVQHVNQVGALNRFKADRAIALDTTLSPIERQKRQIERDIDNVSRIRESASTALRLLDHALEALTGARKLTRDVAPDDPSLTLNATGVRSRAPRVVALIPVDPDRGSIGIARRLADPVAGRMNALQLTLARLASSAHIRETVLLTPEPDRIRELLGDENALRPLRIRIEHIDRQHLDARRDAVAQARLFAPSSWRGAIAGLTIYDELLLAKPMARVAQDFDAALLLGPDWCAVDPALCDSIVERHAEHPSGTRVTFTQAAPGLAPCLIARSMLDEFAVSQDSAQWLATIGASLGYIPIGPQSDPIAKICCVPVDPGYRDLNGRAIMDLPSSRAALAPVLASYADNARHAPTREIVQALADRLTASPAAPQHLTLELCTGRMTSGIRGLWTRGREDVAERPPMDPERAAEIIESALRANPAIAITLAGIGDPLRHQAWREIVRAARAAGCRALHVRTDLLCSTEEAHDLVTSGAGVISVDLMAATRQTYRSIMGVDQYERAESNLTSLIEAVRSLPAPGALPSCWIVPRITRCDESLAEIEPFYDRWLTVAGASVIDPLPRAVAGSRIAPLPLPIHVQRRFARKHMTILSDGRVPFDGHEHGARHVVGIVQTSRSTDTLGLTCASLTDLFRSLWRLRQEHLPTDAPSTRTLLAA
ncbi:MAG: DUF115 domain-containing protein [Phycisphaeraceae bacterium]|nr:DUF115 domain-containing protein [Phycisphaeraceae bacterium]